MFFSFTRKRSSLSGLFLYPALGLALVLPACAVGPDYVRPKVAPPPAYVESGMEVSGQADWRPANPGELDQGPWWQEFKDPMLDSLMTDLGNNNQNVRSAMASLRQARAEVRESRAAFFPALGGTGAISRKRAISNGAPTVGNSYSAVLQAGWEPDIWGGTRRSVEESVAQAEVRDANLGEVILSMRAELATNYFQIRTLDAMDELYAKTVTAYERFLKITEDQFGAGIATRADVARAKSQLLAARAAKVDLELQRRQAEHSTAILLGLAPADFKLPRTIGKAHLPRIDAGIPTALLERRPDVAMAERQVMAANAAIGVAESACFPAFTIPAEAGYASSYFRRWFMVPFAVWSLGPSLVMPLFQGGALAARKDQAVAAWEAATADYRQTVLQAFTDVENALAADRMLDEELQLQEEALAAARDAERMLFDQYEAGTVTFLDVATAQAAALDTARTVEQLTGSRYAASVTLIRALGGGWQSVRMRDDGTSPPAPDRAAQAPLGNHQ